MGVKNSGRHSSTLTPRRISHHTEPIAQPRPSPALPTLRALLELLELLELPELPMLLSMVWRAGMWGCEA